MCIMKGLKFREHALFPLILRESHYHFNIKELLSNQEDPWGLIDGLGLWPTVWVLEASQQKRLDIIF